MFRRAAATLEARANRDHHSPAMAAARPLAAPSLRPQLVRDRAAASAGGPCRVRPSPARMRAARPSSSRVTPQRRPASTATERSPSPRARTARRQRPRVSRLPAGRLPSHARRARFRRGVRRAGALAARSLTPTQSDRGSAFGASLPRACAPGVRRMCTSSRVIAPRASTATEQPERRRTRAALGPGARTRTCARKRRQNPRA